MPRGAGKVGELGVVAEVELLQRGAGGDLVGQPAQVVRRQRQLLDGCKQLRQGYWGESDFRYLW
jgi:hypothetical protein